MLIVWFRVVWFLVSRQSTHRLLVLIINPVAGFHYFPVGVQLLCIYNIKRRELYISIVTTNC